jgi:hypothetical protein
MQIGTCNSIHGKRLVKHDNGLSCLCKTEGEESQSFLLQVDAAYLLELASLISNEKRKHKSKDAVKGTNDESVT